MKDYTMREKRKPRNGRSSRYFVFNRAQLDKVGKLKPSPLTFCDIVDDVVMRIPVLGEFGPDGRIVWSSQGFHMRSEELKKKRGAK